MLSQFQEADLNGDGTIDKDEFINMFDSLFGLQGKVNPLFNTYMYTVSPALLLNVGLLS